MLSRTRRHLRAGALALLAVASAAPAAAVGEQALARIKGRDGRELGVVRLLETTAGVLLFAKLSGLSQGPHGFHFHETGNCTGDFSSAGGIYNPLEARHGLLNAEGPMVGDLPNLVASESGTVEVELLSPFVTLSTDTEEPLLDADGAALVVFERPDDYATDPDGAAGARIGCGVVIGAAAHQ